MGYCEVCQGVIGSLGYCIKCGTCAICFPYGCTCDLKESELEDDRLFDPDDFEEEPNDYWEQRQIAGWLQLYLYDL